MMNKISQPLSNVQLEMLKVFSYNLEAKELLELKDLIAGYFSKRAIKAANKVWEEKGWTNADIEKILNTKMRKDRKR